MYQVLDWMGLHLFKSFKWRKIFFSWEAFCLLHSDSYSCNKYIRSLKGLTEKEGSLAVLCLFFNFSRGWVMYEIAISLSLLRKLLSWDSGFQISNTRTHAHTIGNKEHAVTEMSCLHIEGELDLRWCSLISNYCTCPGTSHCGCSNWRGILKIHEEEHIRIKMKPTISSNAMGWRHRRKKITAFINSQTF